MTDSAYQTLDAASQLLASAAVSLTHMRAINTRSCAEPLVHTDAPSIAAHTRSLGPCVV